MDSTPTIPPRPTITNRIDASHFFLNPELATKTVNCQGHEVPVHYIAFHHFTGLTTYLGDPDDKNTKHVKTIDYDTFYGLLYFLYIGSFYEIDADALGCHLLALSLTPRTRLNVLLQVYTTI